MQRAAGNGPRRCFMPPESDGAQALEPGEAACSSCGTAAPRRSRWNAEQLEGKCNVVDVQISHGRMIGLLEVIATLTVAWGGYQLAVPQHRPTEGAGARPPSVGRVGLAAPLGRPRTRTGCPGSSKVRCCPRAEVTLAPSSVEALRRTPRRLAHGRG